MRMEQIRSDGVTAIEIGDCVGNEIETETKTEIKDKTVVVKNEESHSISTQLVHCGTLRTRTSAMRSVFARGSARAPYEDEDDHGAHVLCNMRL
ncbi:hypothetical protein EVAR_54795_1 [Eumeta japonica]|uniref:Uncharacterized protein n=1 Tax=Eumeta variegata TaxID=151549 RepID=A0A4C1Y0F7_EUMVA|nr:hypothetical protein EVAR_54795_1 [Eumeta japonica]